MATMIDLSPTQKAELNANLSRLVAKGRALYLQKVTASLELEKKLLLLKRKREKRIEEIDKEIAGVETEKMGVEAPFVDDLKETEISIKLVVAELRVGLSSDVAEIKYVGHGTSVTYDYKRLDEFQEADPETWEKIREYRRELEKKPTISVVWK